VTQTGAKQSKTGLSIGGLYGGMGTGSNDPGQTTVKTQNGATTKENPLEQVLKDKILVEQKTGKPVNGLLYFPMEKQKLKELELQYGPKERRITLRFK
jgi:hypothetical protein